MGPLTKFVCHWIYTAIIRPTLAYCSIVWIRAVENKTKTKRLERVQGMALKYMAGAMPSTPYTALNYLTVTPHMTDYLKGEAAKGAVRLMGQGDWTLETAPSGKDIIKAQITISNNFLHTLNINKHDSCDITKAKLVLDHSYTITYPTTLPTEDYKNRLSSNIIEASTHGICCFTDDFKTEHGTGGGFVISETFTETNTELPSKRQPSSMLQKSLSPTTTNK